MKSRLFSAFFALVLVAGTTDLSAGVLPLTKTVPVTAMNSCFDSFRAHRQGKGITLMWTTAVPGDVESFEVQRSYDGEFFEMIADSPAGNNSRFKFSDENVFPGFIYYRVAAKRNDGTTEYSTVEVVRIVSRR